MPAGDAGSADRTGPYGVGFVGAGPVVQTIHLPTIARMPDLFAPVHIMDVDEDLARRVAEGAHASVSTSLDVLLADPAVEVVVIASPHRFHAEQVEAACRAGVRAVLCEKPLAMSGEEADRIEHVAAETGVPVLVGAMHTVDPGWLRAATALAGSTPHTVRSSITLTPNARTEEYASEVVTRPPESEIDSRDPGQVRDLLHGIVMGLAIHDLPLIRSLCASDEVQVLSAEVPPSGGYRIVARAGRTRILLSATKTERWRPQWRLETWTADQAVTVDFPPPYVHAGSAAVTIATAAEHTVLPSTPSNGYEGEWRRLAALLDGAGHGGGGRDGGAPMNEGLAAVLADVRFAIAVAEGAATSGFETVSARGGAR